jgi:hypothetical protein
MADHHFGVQRQCSALPADALGDREFVWSITEMRVSLLKMQRNRIMKTSSSMVTPSQRKVWLESLQQVPTITKALLVARQATLTRTTRRNSGGWSAQGTTTTRAAHGPAGEPAGKKP